MVMMKSEDGEREEKKGCRRVEGEIGQDGWA